MRFNSIQLSKVLSRWSVLQFLSIKFPFDPAGSISMLCMRILSRDLIYCLPDVRTRIRTYSIKTSRAPFYRDRVEILRDIPFRPFSTPGRVKADVDDDRDFKNQTGRLLCDYMALKKETRRSEYSSIEYFSTSSFPRGFEITVRVDHVVLQRSVAIGNYLSRSFFARFSRESKIRDR